MRIGVAIEETWDFFNEIYEEIGEHHEIRLFQRREVGTPFFYERINRNLFRHDLQSLMQWSDVMFFEWASHLLAAATNMPKTCGIVTRLHRYEMYQWVDKINWDVVDKIILVSEAKRREFIDRFPDQALKTVVIAVGISLEKFSPSCRPYGGDIGILCHLTPRKRVYELILDFYEMLQVRSDLHLHIAGGKHQSYADYYKVLKDLVRSLYLEDKVTFYGHVSDPQNWYQKIDIFISNSYSEGLQVAPMEAMASGCFCLSHRWAGAEELLPEEYLYITGDELRDKVLWYSGLSEREKQDQSARMRQIACDKFDLNQTIVQIRETIEEVAAQMGTANGMNR